jgi:hypothetical protein
MASLSKLLRSAEGEPCWCTYRQEHPEEDADFNCGICHSFIKDGMIQFLDDCTHALAGQTVPLGEFEEQDE